MYIHDTLPFEKPSTLTLTTYPCWLPGTVHCHLTLAVVLFSLMSFLLKGYSFPGTPNSSASCHLEAPHGCSLLYSSEREVELELFPTAFWELHASWLSPSGQGQTHYLCRFFILKTLTISIPSFKMVCAHVTCQDCPLLRVYIIFTLWFISVNQNFRK